MYSWRAYVGEKSIQDTNEFHNQLAIDVASPITLHAISVEDSQESATLLKESRSFFSPRAEKYKEDEPA